MICLAITFDIPAFATRQICKGKEAISFICHASVGSEGNEALLFETLAVLEDKSMSRIPKAFGTIVLLIRGTLRCSGSRRGCFKWWALERSLVGSIQMLIDPKAGLALPFFHPPLLLFQRLPPTAADGKEFNSPTLFPFGRALNVALDFAYSHPCVDVQWGPKHIDASLPSIRGPETRNANMHLFSEHHKENQCAHQKNNSCQYSVCGDGQGVMREAGLACGVCFYMISGSVVHHKIHTTLIRETRETSTFQKPHCKCFLLFVFFLV